MNQHFVDSGVIVARPPKPKEVEAETSDTTNTEIVDHVIPYIEEPVNPSKTGNKPKQLVAVEVYGYEVGRGRRKRVVNPTDVYNLAVIGCNDREIARWFDIAEETLRYNFSDIMEKGREDLKHSLRRAMIKNALNGNAALQIFLAKNMLGMSDTPTNNEENKPLPWVDE
jgi:hypothetical protein